MKTAIVTGGAKGIGRAIVEEFAQMGINVVINYNTSKMQAEELKEELISKGYKVEIFKADISKREDAIKLVNFAKGTFGDIDILVNNAGIDEFKMFTDIKDEEWDRMLQNNLNSAFYMTQEIVKDMINRKDGCIINISSIYGINGASCEVHYSVSKAALNGLTKALAKELAPSNIRVNAIAPGAIETDMNNFLSEEEKKVVEQEIPMGKFGKPEDIAKCAKWLVEDEYTTGQIISPNGGWVI